MPGTRPRGQAEGPQGHPPGRGGGFQSRWLRRALQGIKAQWGEREWGALVALPVHPKSQPAPWALLWGFTWSCRAVPSSVPAHPRGMGSSVGGVPTLGCPGWGWGVETPCSPCGRQPQAGQGSPEGSGDTTRCLCQQVMDSLCWGQCPSSPRGLITLSRAMLPDGSVRGSASPDPNPGLVPAPAAPGGSRLGQGQVLPVCALWCPAKVSWGSHAVPSPRLGCPSSGGRRPPIPGIAGTLWITHGSVEGTAGPSLPVPAHLVPVARAGQGSAGCPVCQPELLPLPPPHN